MIQLPEDYMPEWAKYLIATALGAGGVQWFRAFLENRRLAKKDFRDLLLDRIRELETSISNMQSRMTNLRVEIAQLEAENRLLQHKINKHERQNADPEVQGGDDDQPR